MSDDPKVLLVDDSRVFIAIEKQFLSKMPVTVREACSADAALEMCRAEKPDLIYLAVDLQGMNGFDCCRQLKQDSQLKDIPVVLLYDKNGPEVEKLCREAGCDGTLEKPIDRYQFLEAGRRFLDGIREPRKSCLVRCKFGYKGETHSANGLDISSGGLFIDSLLPVMPGELVDLEFNLPMAGGLIITCVAEVTWLNTRKDQRKPNYPIGFGVSFSRMAEDKVELVRKFLMQTKRR